MAKKSLLVLALLTFAGLTAASCGSPTPMGGGGPTGAPPKSPTSAPKVASVVPNVDGETVAKAVQMLTAAGFIPEDSGLSPNDVVTSTSPAGGTYSGGNPDIHFEVTPPTTTTTAPTTAVVPNVEGDTVTKAAAVMTAAGFTLDSSAVYPDSVIAYTDPPAGTQAPIGSAIQDYSCAAGYQPYQDGSSAGWGCNPGDLAPNWGGQ